MYPVSEYYLEAIESEQSPQWIFKGEVSVNKTLPTLTTLDNSDIVVDSFKVDWQSTSNNSFTVGGVCATKVNLTLNSEGIVKLRNVQAIAKGYCIKIDLWLKTADPDQADEDFSRNKDNTVNESGHVPLGYFHISGIKDSYYECELELYDGMLAFDKKISSNDIIELTQGSKVISDWLTLFCNSCSNDVYSLSLASGVASSIINNTTPIHLDKDNMPETYRDCIGYLSILAGGFAVINRYGELDIHFYSKETQLEIEDHHVLSFDTDINLYRTAKVNITVAGKTLRPTNFAYSKPGVIDAEIYLGNNPFLDALQPKNNTLDLVIEIKLMVLNILGKIAPLVYFGGSFEIPNRPELDCGDLLTLKPKVLNLQDDYLQDKEFPYVLLSSHSWSFQGWSNIVSNTYEPQSYSGVTSNSSTSSSGSGSGGGSGSAVNSTEFFVGTRPLALQAYGELKLFDVLFVSKPNITAHASITVTADIEQAGDVEFRIVYDNVNYLARPKWTVQRGYFTFSFDIGLQGTDAEQQHSLVIYMISKAQRYDTESPAIVSIAANEYQLVITASGVVNAGGGWTGRYELSDSIPDYRLGTGSPIKYVNISDTVSRTIT